MNQAFNVGANYILGGGGLDLEQQKLDLAKQAQAFNQQLALQDRDTSGTNWGAVGLSGASSLADSLAQNISLYTPPATPSVTGGYGNSPTYSPYGGASNPVGGQGPATNDYNPKTTSYAEGGPVQPAIAQGGAALQDQVFEAMWQGAEQAKAQKAAQGATPAQQNNGAWNNYVKGPNNLNGSPRPSALPAYDGDGTVEGVGGPKDDMVPARLSPGEYVIPQDVVAWKGEEFFAKLLQKSTEDATKEKQANPPQWKPALVGALQ
jgi:hypothetical protein